MLRPETKDRFLRDFRGFRIIEEDNQENIYTFIGSSPGLRQQRLKVDVEVSKNGAPRNERLMIWRREGRNDLLNTHITSYGDIERTIQVNDVYDEKGQVGSIVSVRLEIQKNIQGIHVVWNGITGDIQHGKVRDFQETILFRSVKKDGRLAGVMTPARRERNIPGMFTAIGRGEIFRLAVAGDTNIYLAYINSTVSVNEYREAVNCPDKKWKRITDSLSVDLTVVQQVPSEVLSQLPHARTAPKLLFKIGS